MKMPPDELRARLRSLLQHLNLLDDKDGLAPIDSLAIVILFSELENMLGIELSPIEMAREDFSSFQALLTALSSRLVSE